MLCLPPFGLQDEYTDAAIVRFCQSKRWNAKKIAKQIQQTAAWRKQVGADLYRTAFIDGKKVLSYPLVVAGLKSCPMLFALGHSKDGCPIDWTAVGHMDMNQALNLMTDDEYFEYNFICLEFFTTHFDRLSFERADGKLCKGMSVMDCAGMGWSFFWPSILKRNNMCAPLMDLYYPESYALFVCINAPGIFEVLFRVLKPFFGQDTIDSVRIVKAADTRSQLAALIDSAFVPACYGGSLKQLPAEWAAVVGLDTLSDDDTAQLMPGPPEAMGGFHRPPNGSAPAVSSKGCVSLPDGSMVRDEGSPATAATRKVADAGAVDEARIAELEKQAERSALEAREARA